MSQPLEERLEAHLGNHSSDHSADPADLTKVRQLARRRSMRTRLAVGICSLAALAGLGSLVPMNDSTSSLVTATEPAPDETMIEDSAETVDPPSTQAQPDPTAEPEQATELEGETAPHGFDVVADGQGGFIAIDSRTVSGSMTFIRSVDGENWFAAETSQLPERFHIQRLRYADGFFVLELDNPPGGLGRYLVHRISGGLRVASSCQLGLPA